nr:hypothetical protein [Paracoccaceae bacterium]
MSAPAPEVRGLLGRLRAEVETNGRFHAAFAIGIAVWLATWGQHPPLRVLLAADVFFAVYIGLMLRAAGRFDAEALR